MSAPGSHVDEGRRWLPLLVFAALLPFLPTVWHFAREGVPDVLFAGDAAALEIRVWQAAHGVQYAGPYSPHGWSHPGPAFFYLAAPAYELLGERGPALNLFVLVVNMTLSLAAVLTVRRLLGQLPAMAFAALLGVYVAVAAPYVPSGEWNAVSPLIPLLCASLLAARLALEESRWLIGFVVLVSAIIQTDIGLGFAALTLTTAVGAGVVWRLLTRDRQAMRAEQTTLAGAAIALAACWALPLYDASTHNPNNLQRLAFFYRETRPAVPEWTAAVSQVGAQLALMPLALGQMLFGLAEPSSRTKLLLGAAQAVALVLTLSGALWRRDRSIAILAAIVLALCVAAAAAVHALRAAAQPHLLFWVVVVGLLAMAVWTGASIRWLERRWGVRRAEVLIVPSAVVLAVAAALTPRQPLLASADGSLERLSGEVALRLRQRPSAAPVIGIRGADTWPAAMGVILHLRKQQIRFRVEPEWVFMAGPSLAAAPGDAPTLFIVDRAFHDQPHPAATLVAQTEQVFVYQTVGP